MTETSAQNFLDKTLNHLRGAWRGIAGGLSGDGELILGPALPDSDLDRLREQMRACLEGRGGEVSARARAASLGRAYIGLSAEGRARFLTVLASDFGVDHADVQAGAQAVVSAADEGSLLRAERQLRNALQPPRVRLLTQFNALPEGVKFLVDLRAELLPLALENSALKGLEADLKDLLIQWFDVGFLELRRIKWDSPASLLERLIAYEAVHAIESWDDLKNRLDSDRRCFAFFHPRMPDEPLIFVEVALVSGMTGNIHALLDEDAPVIDPESADTAIFYSISNAQKGLAGISFGNFLIKRVVDELSKEFKGLKTFATLSPIPGFRDWLDGRFAEGELKFLTAGERKALKSAGLAGGSKGGLKNALESGLWDETPDLAAALSGPLMRLGVRYIADEKRGDGRALDPVAHFHLTNGARVERLNWMADTSDKGMSQSAGMMVNYRYKLDEIDGNHEAYSGKGEVRVSSAIRNLAK
ncbi:MAG: malonyl-CoA decarboxylase [Rhodospirillales bacterium]|nr:malonyl-CoA decarboxylase [Rhodospirillales bacterium]